MHLGPLEKSLLACQGPEPAPPACWRQPAPMCCTRLSPCTSPGSLLVNIPSPSPCPSPLAIAPLDVNSQGFVSHLLPVRWTDRFDKSAQYLPSPRAGTASQCGFIFHEVDRATLATGRPPCDLRWSLAFASLEPSALSSKHWPLRMRLLRFSNAWTTTNDGFDKKENNSDLPWMW